MRILQAEQNGLETLTLESEDLSVSVIPALGGKISSLKEMHTSFEFLFQNPRPPYRVRCPGAAFQDYDASGFDDAFPNVDASETVIAGRVFSFPDHGEIWATPMDAEAVDGAIRLSAHGTAFSYDYEKTVRLSEKTLMLDYAIINRENIPMPCLWTMHCLVNVDPDTRFVLPGGAETAENLFANCVLGDPGMRKVAGTPALTRVPAQGPDVMFKYYLTGPVQEGCCGYTYPSRGLSLGVSFDPEKLPYLGLWCTMGGYRDDCNAAFEPTTGYYDSVSRVMENGCVRMLAPGERFTFSVALSVDFCT